MSEFRPVEENQHGRHPLFLRSAVTLGILAVLSITVLMVSPMLGPVRVSMLDFVTGKMDPASTGYDILTNVRIPRALFGFLAGMVLAVSGVIFQAILRNDLAEPYTLGVSGGSTLGAILCLRTLGSHVWMAVPMGAFIGSIITVSLIYALARVKGARTHPATLLLAGVTLNIVFGAGILLVQYLSEPYEAFLMIRWMMGGLDIDGISVVQFLLIPCLAGLLILACHSKSLNLMTLGDDTAQHLGVEVEWTRRIALGTASLLTAAIVAYSGPIGFVGLIIPHILRHIVGPDHRLLVPASALLGGVFLVICDTIARTGLIAYDALFQTEVGTTELPVGVVTAACGGPFFLYLLFRRPRQ